MQVAPHLLQHYFLETYPTYVESVAQHLRESSVSNPKGISPWTLLTWLDRPAIWAIRDIQRTSGLDSFLIHSSGLPGLTDVAELITFPLQQPDQREGYCQDWPDLLKQKCGLLFATFLWPDWDVLHEQFHSAKPPRSRMLTAICQAVSTQLLRRCAELKYKLPPLLMTTTAGDADLVLYGWVNSASELDQALLWSMTRLDTSHVAEALHLPHSCSIPQPVFRASQTELALELELFLSVKSEIKASGKISQETQAQLNTEFTGLLYSELGMTRGTGSLIHLGDRLSNIMGPQWKERAIFGGEDVILTTPEGTSFAELVVKLALLDLELEQDIAFVRRASLRLGVASASQIVRAGRTEASNKVVPPHADIPAELELAQEEVRRLATRSWREDARILERMVERCLTLQKAHSMSRSTRVMAARALRKIVAHCADIRKLEDSMTSLRVKLLEEEKELVLPKANEVTTARALELVTAEFRLKRNELMSAGMALDRALSHHSRGTVALLLHPASQARGAEHIGSELGLSLGFGALFQKAAQRMLNVIEDESLYPVAVQDVREFLSELRHPTIYASHDLDFTLRPSLGILQLPRWSLWQPLASSHLMHEFGHALAAKASFSDLAKHMMVVVSGVENKSADCQCVRCILCDQGFPAVHQLAFPSGKDYFIKNIKADSTQQFKNELDTMEEVLCDVVARLTAYDTSVTDDTEWLRQHLRHFLPYTGREYPLNLRLLQLMAAYIAFTLLRGGKDESNFPRWAANQATLVETAIEFFWQEVQSWLTEQKMANHTKDWPAWIYSVFSAEVVSARGNAEFCHMYRSLGCLVACVLATRTVKELEQHLSIYRATLVWSALIKNAWSVSDSEDGIIQQPLQGQVPALQSQWPERLPARLTATARRQGIAITPSMRVAFSLYLYDHIED